jgi:hypothetical protein
MYCLSLRRIGMSHLIEGFQQAGLDPVSLFDELTLAHGDAVAPLGDSMPLIPSGILIDVSVLRWEEVQSLLLRWAISQGAFQTQWTQIDSHQAQLEFDLPA